MKQEHGSTGEREKNAVKERGNAKRRKNRGTQARNGPQERAPISGFIFLHRLTEPDTLRFNFLHSDYISNPQRTDVHWLS